jgi:hypothetical protein
MAVWPRPETVGRHRDSLFCDMRLLSADKFGGTGSVIANMLGRGCIVSGERRGLGTGDCEAVRGRENACLSSTLGSAAQRVKSRNISVVSQKPFAY